VFAYFRLQSYNVESTGIGLYVVHNKCELLGGTVTVADNDQSLSGGCNTSTALHIILNLTLHLQQKGYTSSSSFASTLYYCTRDQPIDMRCYTTVFCDGCMTPAYSESMIAQRIPQPRHYCKGNFVYVCVLH
jgi:hypothetical protein